MKIQKVCWPVLTVTLFFPRSAWAQDAATNMLRNIGMSLKTIGTLVGLVGCGIVVAIIYSVCSKRKPNGGKGTCFRKVQIQIGSE